MRSLRGAPLDPGRLVAHADALYRAAWALTGSRHDAEDLVQETYVNVLARPRRFRESELGYLLRALRNTHIDRHRAAARRPFTVELMETDAPYHHESAVDGRAIMQAIAGAPPLFRDAVVAIDVLGLSYAEAACQLDVPEATVTSRLYRGRHHVARLLCDDAEAPQSDREPLVGLR
ncbi:MAG TPA: RNA polymerase sigma factor [Solirubrobacteraceae bacterium]|jgi:RNA polymerase sigma-70 factor (ECF subfamily)|nr:RNA polymerase sigma factor [Solirubrobacteraceae bacterium]